MDLELHQIWRVTITLFLPNDKTCTDTNTLDTLKKHIGDEKCKYNGGYNYVCYKCLNFYMFQFCHQNE